ncbi:hypothetical protein A4X09_0g3548 [Tilletia walkeri]|uniref:F-box domain-containing protein n=1 Tax=Tilletia walkeri TaxID=117179 RepID=A0A8X7NB67_9BASI|nr:hypothetical protein A4X09_0g3548 [Tilletia walkeri]
MSTSSQTPPAAAVVTQQVQELSPDPLLPSRPPIAVATTPPTSSPSSSTVFPFLALPAELIKAILVQCDNSTLFKLRQVCRTTKTIIDKGVSLDLFPFRYWPLIDLPLTKDEIYDIRRRESFPKQNANVWEPDFFKYIAVNPALKRLHWSAEDGWTEARLGSRLRAGDDPASAYESVELTDQGLDFSVKLISRFKVKDFPLVLDELATLPPVSSLQITIRFMGTDKSPVSMVIDPKGSGEEKCATTSSPEVKSDAQGEVPRPVLVKDMIAAIADLTRRCEFPFPSEDPYRGDQDDRTPLLLQYPPAIEGKRENVFGLLFSHADTSGMSSLGGRSDPVGNDDFEDVLNSLMLSNP